MKLIIGLISLFMFMLLFQPTHAQRVLLVEKPGTFKNFKYFVGDDITVRTLQRGLKFEGTIYEITDSSIVIDFDEIMLENIERILKPRWGFGLLSKITRYAGAGYLAIDMVNNAINNEVVVDEHTVKISAGLVAFSYALVPLHNRRLKVNNKWRMKILNFSMEGDDINPFRQ